MSCLVVTVPTPFQTWTGLSIVIQHPNDNHTSVYMESEDVLRPKRKNLWTRMCVDRADAIITMRQFVSARDLENGKLYHSRVIKCGLDQDKFLGNLLVQMYGKCGAPKDAWNVFHRLHQANSFSWNIMIAGYVYNQNLSGAFRLFKQMPHRDMVSWNTMVTAFAQQGQLEKALELFRSMSFRDVISWNIMISAFVQHGHFKEALILFERMQFEGVKPNNITFVSILNACTSQETISQVEYVKTLIEINGLSLDSVIGNTLIHIYGKLGKFVEAQLIFQKICNRSVVSWNVMIACAVEIGNSKEAIYFFKEMQLDDIVPDRVTYINVLNACAGELCLVKFIHSHIMQTAVTFDVVVVTSVINMYGTCRSLVDAYKIFHSSSNWDVITWNVMLSACACNDHLNGAIQFFYRMPAQNLDSWNAMIAGFIQHGHKKEAMQLFQEMQVQGLIPNKFTFASILEACCLMNGLAEGKLVHSRIVCSKLESNLIIDTALLNLYGKCSSVSEAKIIFNSIPRHDIVSWNAMIGVFSQYHSIKDELYMFNETSEVNLASSDVMFFAYSNPCYLNEVMQLFYQMQIEGTRPNNVTYICILSTCGNMADLNKGRHIHAKILQTGAYDVSVGNSIINMYRKCASMEDAQETFNWMSVRDVLSWTLIITAYSQYGHGKKAIQLFQYMTLENVMPTKVTYITILSVCSHFGFLNEGCHLFGLINRLYRITFTDDLYNCIIDMFGRIGWLDEAVELLASMPFYPNAITWTSLLGASRIYGDLERGQRSAEKLSNISADDACHYVLLSNVYAAFSYDISQSLY